jgi:hypothetical protein
VREEEEKGKGMEPSSVPDKGPPAWVVAATDGDQRLRTLCRERGHRTVTGSVASDMGAVTGTRG